MIKITGKDCKKFLDKTVKLINALNRYNIEPIILAQIRTRFDEFEFVFECKSFETDALVYLKSMYIGDEINTEIIKTIIKDDIKKTIDGLEYKPIIIASNTLDDMVSIPKEVFTDKNFMTNFILPMKYNPKVTSYSDSYFIITDLFKKFVKENKISAIDNEFRMYDEQGAVYYDTNRFIFKNEPNEKSEIGYIKNLSPSHLMPIDIRCKENYYLDEKMRKIFVRLNTELSNSDEENYIHDPDVGIVESKTEIDNIMLDIKEKNPVVSLRSNKNIQMFPSELIKTEPDKILFTKIRLDTQIVDNESDVKFLYDALVALVKGKSVIYIYYRFIDMDF